MIAHDTTPLIQVLLATYNGERFLREQIDSVLAQTYAPVEVLVRDDGSSDATQTIVGEYVQRFPGKVRLVPNDGTGGNAQTNFLRLLEASDAPYVAFCDQDDVWLPEKLALEMDAMRSLEARFGEASPLLVYTDLRVVDQSLKTVAESFWQHQLLPLDSMTKLEKILVQNVVTGCTELMNSALRSMVLQMPAAASMHDWWSALCVGAMGHATALATPTVLYRQHDSNVLGAMRNRPVTGVPAWRNHTARLQTWQMIVQQAEAFLRVYSEQKSSDPKSGDQLPADAQRKLRGLLRCNDSRNRIVRVASLFMGGYLQQGLRRNLATAWLLWDLDEARRQQQR
ncbi:glycosyltransferase family 2 protein [Granulicella cerasi]|uniref:Glycosyltransferase family 2 protein n=1 Tax=Granulicella cerasi TaxID=741063 RepID=A0ABW1ZBE2_9BACT|nr:glycosyltransferase family 2 protein [Granulicella cerasi]